MLGLFVSDLPRMVAFYRDVLRFEIEWNGEGPYAEFKHPGVRFSMYDRSRLPELLGRTPAYPRGLNGSFELAIDLPTFDEVDYEYQRVMAAGAVSVYAPRDEPWGMRSAMIADPDGNLIEISSWNTGSTISP
jgi:catechol 2,3-dioxygenase-like lactoylglutathione lyase family enzyme